MANRTEYFNKMYGYARDAGLPDHLARLAVTQSALETGYGKSVKGNNYFGIKAGKSWDGPVQSFKTWEDVGGKRVNITDKFRKYDNPTDAFKDWQKTVSRRWPDAISAKDFPSAIDGLKYGQQGGYASDKNYKSKLTSIDRGLQRAQSQSMPFGNVPIPSPAPRGLTSQVAFEPRSFDRGGILSPAKISFNPISSANAGEMPKQAPRQALQQPIQRSALPPIPPRNTLTGASYTPIQQGGMSTRQNAVLPMSQGSMPQLSKPPVNPNIAAGYQQYANARALPQTPVQTAQVPTATLAANYGYYGKTRQTTPDMPMAQKPATSIQGPLGEDTNIGPVAAPTPQSFTQRLSAGVNKALAPDNLKKMGAGAAGSLIGAALAGPAGGIIGGLLGREAMGATGTSDGQGLLSGLFGGGNGYQGQSTYIGNGMNAVNQAMNGNRMGDTASYNSQGGGTVTNLGNGQSQRTSSKYGWTETTNRDGSKSISYKK